MGKMLVPIWNVVTAIKKLIKIICLDGLLKQTFALTVGGSGPHLSYENLPDVLQQLVTEIEGLLDSYYSSRSRTLPVKILQQKQNITLTWNIYPTEKISLSNLLLILVKTIETIFKSIKGEVIQFNLSNGKIHDGGVQEFQISSGKIWEIYLYEPEIFIYLRLLLESRITQPHENWISIDIDIVEKSAWFVSSE